MYEPIKEETKEQYLKIWAHYSVGHFNERQLAELFGCSVDTVQNAICWCAQNRLQFKSQVLVEAAKEAVEARLRELKNDLIRIKEANPVNWNAVIGIHKLIKENEELLWRLQAVIQDKNIITINTTQISQVVRARDELLEGATDDKRREIISRVREVLGKQDNVNQGA